MSLSNNYPDIRSVWMNDYANAGVIDPRCSFARSDSTPSNVHYWSSEDHLSSENLFKYSNDLSTGWLEDNVTFTGGQTAPDGGSDAYKITENSASSEHRFYPSAAIATDGGTTTFSGYFKYIGRQWIVVKLNDGSTDRRVWFDIQNGAVGTTNTGITASIAASGGGYYKVSATITTSSTSYFPLIGGASADNVYVYAGSGADAFYVWGLQYNHNVGSVLNETSGSIHREYQTKLQTAASGAARFEHSAIDGQSGAKGILLESASTNLITYSNNFGVWSALRVTAEAGASVGPDGQLCYVMREDTTAANTHYLSLGASGQSTSTTYTMSVYAKKVATSNQTRHLRLRVNGIGGEASVEYNLANGTVNRTYGSSLDSSSISSIGNGWYRLVMTYTNPGGSVASGMIITGSPDTTATLPSYDGDGFSAFGLFGAMGEEGSYASSLVTSNSGSQTTRAADSLSVATADIGYTGGDFSLVFETPAGTGQGSYPTLFEMGVAGTTTNRLQLYKSNSTASASDRWYAYQNSTGIGYVTGSAGSSKVAISYANSDLAIDSDTGTLFTDTSQVVPLVDQIAIGSNDTFGNQLNGNIKRVALYDEALSDTNLISLTS